MADLIWIAPILGLGLLAFTLLALLGDGDEGAAS